MLIDTHAHLTDEKLIHNMANVLDSAKQNGIDKIITIGCTIEDAKKSIELAKNYPEFIYATVGLYPHDSDAPENRQLSLEDRLKIIKELAKSPEVIAIGECGYDLFVEGGRTEPAPGEIARSKKDQTYIFETQIEIAKELKLPIVIHSRNAKSETLAMLKKHKPEAVWHCFTEDLETLKQIIDLGLYISIGGIITYKNSDNTLEAVKNCPIDRLLLETDAPYLVPEPLRSRGIKPNEPAYVNYVFDKIAEIKNIDKNQFSLQLAQNSKDIFKF